MSQITNTSTDFSAVSINTIASEQYERENNTLLTTTAQLHAAAKQITNTCCITTSPKTI